MIAALCSQAWRSAGGASFVIRRLARVPLTSAAALAIDQLRCVRRMAKTGAVPATVVMLAVLLGGCGSGAASGPHRTADARLPAALLAQARPVGVGPAFHPPVTGSPLGACRARLGRRYPVHLEVFRANRVVLVAAGIGVRDPLRTRNGRILRARCYGAAVTADPTGVVLVRRGARVTLGELFASWGVPLRGRLYIDGRRWPGGARSAESLKLTRHAEMVVETGPYVPPHHTYRFAPNA